MFVQFEGKGCNKCPFFHVSDWGSKSICGLDGRDNTGDGPMNIEIEDQDKKPRSCPFTWYPYTLEIIAEEGE